MKRSAILFLWLVAALPLSAFALTPLEYFNSLVAGGDEPGFQDGSFVDARFNHPLGMVIDDQGNQLFIADSGNHRIRVVDLAHQNKVATLTGTSQAGTEDGALDKASFDQPARLALISSDRLAVYDAGSHRIRLIDLKAKSVTTLASDVVLWDMVYRPQNDSLYFSEPEVQTLAKLNLKSLAVSTVFTKNPQLPAPQAVCVKGDKLYVADRVLTGVYEISLEDNKTSDQEVVALREAGHAHQVIQLACSGDKIYALQSGPVPLARVEPSDSVGVSLGTPWGFFIQADEAQTEPFLNFQAGQPAGFFASPKEIRKLYISQPGVSPNAIITVTDYAYDQYWNLSASKPTLGVMDYDYPAEKPRDTYRILLAGDSRTNIAPKVIPGSKYDVDWFYNAPRTGSMAKQLELYLNTEAALQGVKTHFQVLEWNRAGAALSSYAYYELPPLVKRYQIDLVLALTGRPGFSDYFNNTITSEGIPANGVDVEYLLKPFSQRIPAGAPMDFYQRLKKKVNKDMEKGPWPWDESEINFMTDVADAPMREDMIEMSGRRLWLLSQKLQSMKTDGYEPRLLLFHVPWISLHNNNYIVSYWSDLGKKFDIPFMDLSEPFNAMGTSYYPMLTACCDGHYTAYGDKLVGYILSRYLVENNYVPFEADK